MPSPTETVKNALKTGKPLAPYAVSRLRKQGAEEALRANAANIISAMLSGVRITRAQFEEVEHYFPERAQEYLEAGGSVREDRNERQTCAAIARRIGIAQPTLYKLLRAHDDAPRSTSDGKYDADEVVKWYTAHKVARTKPTSLKEQALAEDIRLKRAKANIAEGKAIPTDEAQELFLQIYTLAWNCILTNAKRYGEKEDEAIQNARADFSELRQKLEELSSLD